MGYFESALARGVPALRHVVSIVAVVPFATMVPSGAEAASIRACSLLDKELVEQVSPYDKQALDLVLKVPPNEDAAGQAGSQCDYGGITLAVDAFSPGAFDQMRERDRTWMPVGGLGDRAYFRDNKARWGELYVVVGSRVLSIQMAVPTGRTAASIQPNAVALAKAVLPRLR
jgi:hypothetical protein